MNSKVLLTCIAIRLCSLAAGALADVYEFPALAKDPQSPAVSAERSSWHVLMYGTSDIEAFRPVIIAFQEENRQYSVTYHELQSLDIYDRVIEETRMAGRTADLVISSGMDLQMKLANDGFTQPHRARNAAAVPDWAKWRDEAIGVTFEPAVMVYNRDYFAHEEPPHSRLELMALLAERRRALQGRVATYDIERSGLGFLFLARDERHFPAIWELVQLMGDNRVQLFSNSASMINRVAEGKFVLGYNLLGSYAEAIATRNSALGVILPDDYAVVLSRIALVPKAAGNAAGGTVMLDYILSAEGQRVMAHQGGFNAVRPDVQGIFNVKTLTDQLGERLRPITVGPGLLVYMDQAKRERLIKRWRQALTGG